MNRCLALALTCLIWGTTWLQARTWTDVKGRQLDADFVKAQGTHVLLKLAKGGRTVSVPLNTLSEEDQKYAASQAAAAEKKQPAQGAGQKDRFDDVRPFKKSDIPLAGTLADKSLEPVEDAILEFMVAKGIPAVSFALSKDGKLLEDRAYGWGDAKLDTPLPVGLSMRLASISKPITQAGIRTLIEQKKLKLEDKVFEVMELQTLADKDLDPRWRDITIQHLLEHKGGWDRDKSGDFSYNSTKVCEDLRIKLKEMVPMDLVRWHLKQPLDFDPGSKEVYCNFGYTLLARVVEKVSGKSFVESLNETVGKESGMTTLRVSRSDAEDRLPGEVWYCLHPEFTKEMKVFPTRMETKDGSGALACSAADYCRFLEHYSIIGNTRQKGGRYTGTFFGSTYGVTSVCCQRADGICYTVICNRRPESNADWNKELKVAVDEALEKAAIGL